MTDHPSTREAHEPGCGKWLAWDEPDSCTCASALPGVREPAEPTHPFADSDPILRQAEDELARLCAGRGHTTSRGLAGRSWTMCVPVQPNDSDVVFGNALAHAHELARALSTAHATAERTQRDIISGPPPSG